MTDLPVLIILIVEPVLILVVAPMLAARRARRLILADATELFDSRLDFLRQRIEDGLAALSKQFQEGLLAAVEAAKPTPGQRLSRSGVEAREDLAAMEEQITALILEKGGALAPAALATLEEFKREFPQGYKRMIRNGPAAVQAFLQAKAASQGQKTATNYIV